MDNDYPTSRTCYKDTVVRCDCCSKRVGEDWYIEVIVDDIGNVQHSILCPRGKKNGAKASLRSTSR